MNAPGESNAARSSEDPRIARDSPRPTLTLGPRAASHDETKRVAQSAPARGLTAGIPVRLRRRHSLSDPHDAAEDLRERKMPSDRFCVPYSLYVAARDGDGDGDVR